MGKNPPEGPETRHGRSSFILWTHVGSNALGPVSGFVS